MTEPTTTRLSREQLEALRDGQAPWHLYVQAAADALAYMTALEQARIAELTHLIGDADTGLAERLSSALDRIAELEGILRPFKRYIDGIESRHPNLSDDYRLDSYEDAITLGELRQARDMLDKDIRQVE